MRSTPSLIISVIFLFSLLGSGCSDSTENTSTTDTVATDTTSTDTTSPDTTTEDIVFPDPDINTVPPSCVPELALWEEEVSTLIEERCGFCHGDTPDYGAPYSLLDYEGMLEGEEGSRPVDRVVARLMAGTMPPIGQPTPPVDVLNTIVSWGSCGEEEITDAPGIQSTAPVFQGPSEAPEGLAYFDLTSDEFEVSPDTLDLYQCFILEAPIDSDKFVRRIEPIIDESAVLHHIVLLRDVEKSEELGEEACFGMPAGSEYLYAWAPGTGPVQFDDGGIRIGAGERFVLQTHYNNGLALEDIKDSSGLRIYYSEPEGKEYGMFAPGPLAFAVGAFSSATIEGACTLTQDMEILASLPHMHEIGSAFDQHVVKANGDIEPVISLNGWSFEMQLFYDTPHQLSAGDKLITTCEFDNPNESTVVSGLGTSDEMCFNFMYVTPPPPERYCDETPEEEFSYSPGECAPQPPLADTPIVDGQYVEGSPPAYAGGEPEDGLYVMNDYTMFLLPPGIPLGELDYEKSFIRTSGQMEIKDGLLTLDYAIQINVILIGLDFTLQETQHISSTGTYVPGEEPNTVLYTTTCPDDETTRLFRYETQGDMVLINTDEGSGPINVSIEMVFERVSDANE